MLKINDLTVSKELARGEMAEVIGGTSGLESLSALIDFSTSTTNKVADVNQIFGLSLAQGQCRRSNQQPGDCRWQRHYLRAGHPGPGAKQLYVGLRYRQYLGLLGPAPLLTEAFFLGPLGAPFFRAMLLTRL